MKLIIGCVAILAGIVFFWSACSLPPIPEHQGDGVFRNISRRIGLIPLPGYTISMPEFDLTQPFQAEYKVSGLTNLGRKCGVYLAFDDPELNLAKPIGQEKERPPTLSLMLTDSRGRTVVDAKGNLHEFIWSSAGSRIMLYQMERSFFHPNINEEYTLRIAYTPDPAFAGYRGFVLLESSSHP